MFKLNYKIIIKILILLFSVEVQASCLGMDNWRSPTEEDYIYDWVTFKNSSEKPYYAESDFNGDGLIDKACFLFSLDGNRWGLFVFLSKENGSVIKKLVEQKVADAPPQVRGIGIVPLGTYQTACGKGYYKCDSNNPEELVVQSPMLDYYRFESANSFFYWDKEKSSFESVWISD